MNRYQLFYDGKPSYVIIKDGVTPNGVVKHHVEGSSTDMACTKDKWAKLIKNGRLVRIQKASS